MEHWTDFTLALNISDILRGQGMDPASSRAKRPALIVAAEAALQRGLPELQPSVVYHEATVREHRHERILLDGGIALTGPLAAMFLAGASSVAAAVCTIGPGVEALATSVMSADPLLALALDGLGNAAVEALGQQVCGRIAEKAQADGLETSAPLSPGEPDWPVDVGQPQIFSLLDARRVGVNLTEGGMMIPKKTISFVVGIGPRMEQTNLCELCSMKERCRYRHA